MQTGSSEDYLNDLPEGIIETILTKLPLKDAVRTSILYSKWRYKWATLIHLKFDDECVSGVHDKSLADINIIKFICRFLLLHDGPINTFSLSTSYLQSLRYIDQWLLYLSKKEVKELVVDLGKNTWVKAPSSLFSCQNLVRLELVRWELVPPFFFKGFPYLKHLNLQQVDIAQNVLENLISDCPLLESLNLSYYHGLQLTIQYMSKGNNTFGKKEMKYEQLKVIELSEVDFEDTNEIKAVLRLIINAPNLQQLQISSSSDETESETEASDLDFWEKECLFDCTFDRLKTVKMMNMSGVPHEVKFIEFLLGNSPVLETISITQKGNMIEDKFSFLTNLTKFPRASAEAEMVFV